MTETSTHNHILLLHSSCKTDDDGASRSEGTFATTGNDTTGFDFLKETIVCNMLFIPEHPSSTLSEHDYLHLHNNPLNPCGLSNVLTLETLPKHWISGPILLSLSSCHILHPNNNFGHDNETTIPTAFFVEPIPSTFVLDFSSEHDTPEGRNFNDNIIAVNEMSEIHVVFDVRETLMQATGVLRHENSTRTNSSDNEDKDDHLLGNDESDALDSCEYDEIDVPHNDRHSNRSFDEAITVQAFNDRELLLRHLNARLDHGSQTIDSILLMSCFFCLLSLVVLLWAICQFYRTNVKSDRLSQEIRQCMKKSHDMLQTAVEEINVCQNHRAKSLHQPAKEEEPVHERNYPTTPKRNTMHTHIYKDDTVDRNKAGDESQNQIVHNQTPVRLFAAKASLGQEGRQENQLCFTGPLSNHRGHAKMKSREHGNTSERIFSPSDAVRGWTDRKVLCEKKNIEIETPLSPCSGLTIDSNDGEARSVHVDRKITLRAPLSPCSQLEKEWNEGKTIRRGNLKKRRQLLKPILHSNDVDESKQLDTPSQKNEDRVIDENILDPPNLRSTARASDLLDDARIEDSLSDQTAKNPKLETEGKTIEGLKTPPLNLVSEKAPLMCYTPASEDDSFVDDYW